jgi:antitoxin component YwqK of YwqJK toxin-antitoxin module
MRRSVLVPAIALAACTSAPRERVLHRPDGTTLTQVNVRDGVKDGMATVHLGDGRVKSGLYRNDLKSGAWTVRNAEGDTIGLFNYRAGKAHGEQQRFANGICVFRSTFVYGEEHGMRRTWYPDGSTASETPFVHGKEHGIMHRWGERDTLHTGRHVVGLYVHGVMEGPWRRFYDNGQLCSESPYVNGLRNGTSRVWSRDGRLVLQREYRNDRVIATPVDELN